MLRMTAISAPAPSYVPVSWQQTATPIDHYEQADCTAPANLIWHGDQTSAVSFLDEAEPRLDPVQIERNVFPNTLSPFFGVLRRVACTLFIGSFLALSGCDYIDGLLERKQKLDIPVPDLDQPPEKGTPRFLVGRGRTMWHAKQAMVAQGEALAGHKDRFSHCFGKKIHIKYVGKPTCRKIKRHLYECQRLWEEVHCYYSVGRQRNRKIIWNDKF